MADPTSEPRSASLLPPIALGLWLGVVFGYLYIELISQHSLPQRRVLFEQILRGEVKSDYLYATYTVAQVQRLLVGSGLLTDSHCFALIDGVGIVALFGCAGWFLGVTFPQPQSRFAAFLWLAVTSPLLLFRHHFYHPSDFYATALMFLILHAARHGHSLRLGVLCLLSGCLWEKVLFVPGFFFLWEYRKVGLVGAGVCALPALAATLGCFVFWRVAFPDAPREWAHESWSDFARILPLAAVDWCLWLAPIGVVGVDIAWRRRPVDPFWRYWIVYLPLLFGVIVAVRGQLRELRSFWIMQPIFAGLIASWVEGQSKRDTPAADRPRGYAEA